MSDVCVYWFRKALRLHDNPSLLRALSGSTPAFLAPVFVIDPAFRGVGALRYAHLLDSLLALDEELRSRGSGLLLLEGKPEETMEAILGDVGQLAWETDMEPYALERDGKVRRLAERRGVDVVVTSGHTLFDLDVLRRACGGAAKAPTTFGSFQKLVSRMEVPRPLDAPQKLPPLPLHLGWVKECVSTNPASSWMAKYARPLADGQHRLFVGGERTALAKMQAYCSKANRVTTFEKPKTDPTKAWYGTNAADVSAGATTVLSPYLKFGTLSCRLFYWTLRDIESKSKGGHSNPPESLVGQLLWREFFTFTASNTPNFGSIAGNPLCRQISWKENEAHLDAWALGRTGFPWIDACMAQLRKEGWIHHLGESWGRA